MSKEYTWHFNEYAEWWGNDYYNSIEECIVAAKEYDKSMQEKHSVVYIGEVVPYTPVVDVESVLEGLEETAYEQCGEAAEDWDAFIYREDKDQLDELSVAVTKIVSDWLKKNNRYPSFYSVEDIREYPIPQRKGE